MDQVAARDTTFDDIGPIKTAWVKVSNIHKGDRDKITIILELNGVEKLLQEHYIHGLSEQGIILHSTNLTGYLAQ